MILGSITLGSSPLGSSSGSSDITLTISGVSSTTYVNNILSGIWGVQTIAGVGNLLPNFIDYYDPFYYDLGYYAPFSNALTSVTSIGYSGLVTPKLDFAVLGVQSNTATDIIATSQTVTFAISGVSTTFATGTEIPVKSYAISGNQTVVTPGSVSFNQAIFTPLTGVQSNTGVSNVNGVTLNITGVHTDTFLAMTADRIVDLRPWPTVLLTGQGDKMGVVLIDLNISRLETA